MLALVATTTACEDVSKHLSFAEKPTPGLIKAASAEQRFDGATDEWALVPVPPADGPVGLPSNACSMPSFEPTYTVGTRELWVVRYAV